MQAFGLHPDFGVEVRDVDLRTVTADRLYPEIRELFERHSLLLFRGPHDTSPVTVATFDKLSRSRRRS